MVPHFCVFRVRRRVQVLGILVAAIRRFDLRGSGVQSSGTSGPRIKLEASVCLESPELDL